MPLGLSGERTHDSINDVGTRESLFRNNNTSQGKYNTHYLRKKYFTPISKTNSEETEDLIITKSVKILKAHIGLFVGSNLYAQYQSQENF